MAAEQAEKEREALGPETAAKDRAKVQLREQADAWRKLREKLSEKVESVRLGSNSSNADAFPHYATAMETICNGERQALRDLHWLERHNGEQVLPSKNA